MALAPGGDTEEMSERIVRHGGRVLTDRAKLNTASSTSIPLSPKRGEVERRRGLRPGGGFSMEGPGFASRIAEAMRPLTRPPAPRLADLSPSKLGRGIQGVGLAV